MRQKATVTRRWGTGSRPGWTNPETVGYSGSAWYNMRPWLIFISSPAFPTARFPPGSGISLCSLVSRSSWLIGPARRGVLRSSFLHIFQVTSQVRHQRLSRPVLPCVPLVGFRELPFSIAMALERVQVRQPEEWYEQGRAESPIGLRLAFVKKKCAEMQGLGT